jgi:hypothetical protein
VDRGIWKIKGNGVYMCPNAVQTLRQQKTVKAEVEVQVKVKVTVRVRVKVKVKVRVRVKLKLFLCTQWRYTK